MRRIGALMDIGETDSNAKAWVEAFETQLGKAELAQGAQLGNPRYWNIRILRRAISRCAHRTLCWCMVQLR